MTVLVVDAALAVRSRLVLRLREAGLNVIEAGGADAGLRLAREVAPAAVVLDIDLPGLRGLQLIAALKATVPDAALLVFTNAVVYRKACLTAGAHYFLDKSSEFDRVAPTLAVTIRDSGSSGSR